MKRRTFLTTTLATVPLAIGATSAPAQEPKKTTPAARPKKGIRVAAGEARSGKPIKLPMGNTLSWKVSAKDTDGAMSVFEGRDSNKGGTPLHVHHDQDELFFVLQGEYEIQVGEGRFPLKAGDSVFAPRKIPHAVTKFNDKPGKLLVVLQPAGKLEEFFEAMIKLKWPPSEPEMQKLFTDHGMKVVGPPLKID